KGRVMRGSKERRRSISGLTLIESDECAAESNRKLQPSSDQPEITQSIAYSRLFYSKAMGHFTTTYLGPRKEVEFALWYRRKRKVAADECPE
ncbi:hypothetical protein PIB30_100336, partial [Stylosanthes scabra]|nr:hypothetical protein [Stylosanthes scabra]